MLIRYDKEIDAKYIILLPAKQKKGVVKRTQKIQPWLMADYDEEGNIFAVEILDASQHPISLSVIDGKEIQYSLETSDELEGNTVLVGGELVFQ